MVRMFLGIRLSTVVFGAVLAYFAVNAFIGQQGLISWHDHARRADSLMAELSALQAREAELADRVARLRGAEPDADLVEEVAWQQLGMARPDAWAVMLPEPAAPVAAAPPTP